MTGLAPSVRSSCALDGELWVPDHIVACIHQLGNEPAANGAARSGDENAHRVLLFVLLVTSRGSRGSTSMTRDAKGM